MTLEHRGVVVKELRLSPPLKPCLVLREHLHFALSENRIVEAKLGVFLAAANRVSEKKSCVYAYEDWDFLPLFCSQPKTNLIVSDSDSDSVQMLRRRVCEIIFVMYLIYLISEE